LYGTLVPSQALVMIPRPAASKSCLLLDVRSVYPFCFDFRSKNSKRLYGNNLYPAPLLLLLPADFTEHIRMNVQTDVGHIVEVLTCNKPDDLTDLTFRVIAGQARKRFRLHFFIRGKLRHIVQCRAFCIAKRELVRYCPSASNLA